MLLFRRLLYRGYVRKLQQPPTDVGWGTRHHHLSLRFGPRPHAIETIDNNPQWTDRSPIPISHNQIENSKRFGSISHPKSF